MSIEVKTTGMIVVIFLVVVAVFARQLSRDLLMQLGVALTVALVLVVAVLDVLHQFAWLLPLRLRRRF